MNTTAPPPVVAPGLSSLLPHTLPVVPRLDLLSGILNRMQRYEQTVGQRQGLVLVGEGGMGKSVLLGQLINRISADRAQPLSENNPFAGATTLVTCASVSPGVKLTTAADVDLAFGNAVGGAALYYNGLLGLLTAQKVEYGAATLLIDTLDLLIAEHSLPALASFIAAALESAHVVFSCRTYEYSNYLQDAHQSVPVLDGRIIKLNLPGLGSDEIIAWARAYIEQADDRAVEEETGFLRSLRGGIDQNGPLRQVCSVPVRLALTCETFAASQHVPADLTVTDLYDTYWQARIRRDKGKAGTIDGDAKEQAALKVASHTVTSDGNISLHVPKGQLDSQHLHGLRLLASEGVLRDLGTVWEFFHQTFAEYSYARWLLTQGITPEAIQRLGYGLRSGQTGLWPVVRSLLLQIPEDEDYQAIAEQLQLVGPEGAHTQALSTLRRLDSGSLQIFLQSIKDHPELLAAALPALADSPSRHIPTAIFFVSDTIASHAPALASLAVATLGSLMPRAKQQELPEFLNRALDNLITARGQLPSVKWEQLAWTLLGPLIDVSELSESLPVLCSKYKSLSGRGRQAIVRIYLAHSLSAEEIANFARVALSTERPPLRTDEAMKILDLFWNCQEVRHAQGWVSWRDLVSSELPRDWNDAQINLVAKMAAQDDVIGRQIIDDLLEARAADAPLYVQVFKKLVELKATWVASEVLSHQPPREAVAAGGVAEGVSEFVSRVDSATRAAIIEWLKSCRTISPRNVWSVQISLASNSVPLHEQIFDELMRANEPQPVVDSAVDAWLFSTPGSVLGELAIRLRSLLRARDVKTRGIRARLEGKLFMWDVQARDWIEREVLHGPSPRVAGTAVKTVIDMLETSGQRVTDSICYWLIKLLDGPHTDATQRLATFLGRSQLIDEVTLSSAAAHVTPRVIDRMLIATRNGEDSQVARELLELLVRLDNLSPLQADEVRTVCQITRNRLNLPHEPDPHVMKDESAAVRDMGHLMGTLISRRLSAAEGRALLGEFLSAIDGIRFGNKFVKILSSILIGLAHRDAEAISWMENLFAQEDLSNLVRLAIAAALLQIDGHHVGGLASQLKDRPDCPPEVATYIVTRLRH